MKNVVLLLLLALGAVACRDLTPVPDPGAESAAIIPPVSPSATPTEEAGTSQAPGPVPTWGPLQSPTPTGTTTVMPSPTPTNSPVAPVDPSAAPPTMPGCVPPPSDWQPHIVRFGDTTGRLAQCVGALPAAIVTVNCLPDNGNLIYPGQVLYLPGLCAPTITPPPSNKDGNPSTATPTPTRLPPPPSKDGQVKVNVDEASPGQEIVFTLEHYVPYGLYNIKFESDTASIQELHCVNQNGYAEIKFTIPDNFSLDLAINPYLSDDEATRLKLCGGELGSAGYTEGQLATPLRIVTATPTPTPTSTATATAEPPASATATATAEPPATDTPEPTIPPPATPAPPAYP